MSVRQGVVSGTGSDCGTGSGGVTGLSNLPSPHHRLDWLYYALDCLWNDHQQRRRHQRLSLQLKQRCHAGRRQLVARLTKRRIAALVDNGEWHGL